MSPQYERACMAAAGLVPIPFDTPDANICCAGKMRISKPQLLGICILCRRLSDGPQKLEPAARVVAGLAQCPNFAELGVFHTDDVAPSDTATPCRTLGMGLHTVSCGNVQSGGG